MLQAIVAWSTRNRVAVLVLSGLLLAAGLYAAAHAHLDAFPEFSPPQVVVQTEAPGLSAQEVEQLVTLPLEQALSGASGLAVVRSRSIQGLSAITLLFTDNTDIYRARQQVTERLAEVDLPEGVQRPRLGPMTKTSGRLVVVGFTSDTLPPLDLRDRVQWVVRPRLLAVGGVAQVTLFGGEVRQFQVRADPDALAAHRLTLDDLLRATREATGVRGAGFQESANQRLVLRAEGQVASAAELGEAVVTVADGVPVRLKDVAAVAEAGRPKFGDALIDGRPGVALLAYRQFDADTLETTRAIDAELEAMRPALARDGITIRTDLFRQADFIQKAVGNVTHSLLVGAALVAVVLFALLFNVRTAVISLTAIPLSLLAAVLVLWACGVTLNTLTLGGLAIAVGEVVDDAIIDVENIYRRLRENARLGHPKSAATVVLAASLEVRTSVVYATFIVVLVFVPVFFLSGVQGRLFAPLGYAYVLAVMASLATALTLTPALSLVLLPRAGGAEEPPLLRRLQGGYEWLVRRLDREFTPVAGLAVALVAAAGVALTQFGGEFLPELREEHLIVHLQGVSGSSLARSVETGKAVTAVLREDPAVRGVCQLAGRAELGEDTWGVEYSEVEVPLRDGADVAAAQRRIRDRLRADFRGYNVNAFTFLSETIHDSLAGSVAPVVVKVFGDDPADLDRAAAAVARTLEGVPGAEGVQAEPQAGQPEVVVRVRPRDAARLGLRSAQVLDAVHAAYQGARAGQAYDRNRVVDLVVLLDPAARTDPGRVGDLWLAAPPLADPVAAGPEPSVAAGRVQLRQVADVFLSDGRFLVTHEGARRVRLVACAVKGRDVEGFAADAERRLRGLALPDGVSCVVAGEHVGKQAAQRELLLLGLAAGVGVALLLWTALRSARLFLLVALNLPFALVGGVAAVYLQGGVLNVGSLVGFVTLFGISTRNGVMMASHWQHLRDAEGVPWGPDLVFRGARERLAPVLMTALVTGLGLLPIALGSGEAGREIEGPMAVVILGGLVTSTALNLLVLPLVYRRLGAPRRAEAAA